MTNPTAARWAVVVFLAFLEKWLTRNWETNVTEIELTMFEKRGGILTKKIGLDADGKIHNDRGECAMGIGTARRVTIEGVVGLKALLDKMQKNQAIALGALRPDLANTVNVITAKNLHPDAPATTITREAKNFVYRPKQPAFLLFDIDLKDATDAVKERIAAHRGNHWAVLCDAFPGLAGAAHLTRASTSAGLSRSDTEQKFPSSGGSHTYVPITDGADAERALYAAHDRAVLAGYGWIAISVAGRFLRRSIVDRLVWQPGRLVFEAPPDIIPPLKQDLAAREPIAVDGETRDGLVTWAPLSVAERARLDKLWAEMERAREPERQRIRNQYVADRAPDLARKRGIPIDVAKRAIERRCEAVLLPDDEVEFDDLRVVKISAILDDPAAHHGAHLSDPLEGPNYGRGKAYIHLGVDDEPWIFSFAHGGINYSLRYDAAAVRARLETTSDTELVDRLVKLLLWAEVTDVEEDALVDEVASRAHAKPRSIKAMIKAARENQRKRRAEAARQRATATRTDPRPRIVRPPGDAPLIPMIKDLNDVVAVAPLRERLYRNIDRAVARKRRYAVPNTHAWGDVDGTEPAPEQWAIAALNEIELAEAVEKFVDYVHPETSRSVTPPPRLVKAFLRRDDGVLPTITSVATAPIVLADGGVLAQEDGIDVERGVAFAVSPEAMAWVPRREECTLDAVRDAMKFITDDWLVDVATDYAGKCVAVAAALTVVERSLLRERPAFFVDAGRHSAGKGTTIQMIIKAVTGELPAMAAWSTDENERRKAILGYLLAAVACIPWDNIPTGSKITCPHVERSCTSPTVSDRILGASEIARVPSYSVHFFIGNNIAPKGDLASRTLVVRLDVDRPDPENRKFTHPDPIQWTTDNRSRIMQALFTILLGNPTLKLPRSAQMETRFKLWYRLIGSAVEHAARLAQEGEEKVVAVAFKDLFRRQTDEDVDDASLGDVLAKMREMWPNEQTFKTSDVLTWVNWATHDSPVRQLFRDFFYPEKRGRDTGNVSAQSLGQQIGKYVGNPVWRGDDVYVLKATRDTTIAGHASKDFQVVVTPRNAPAGTT